MNERLLRRYMRTVGVAVLLMGLLYAGISATVRGSVEAAKACAGRSEVRVEQGEIELHDLLQVRYDGHVAMLRDTQKAANVGLPRPARLLTVCDSKPVQPLLRWQNGSGGSSAVGRSASHSSAFASPPRLLPTPRDYYVIALRRLLC